MLPQNRQRIFVQGVRKDLMNGSDVPAPLSPFGTARFVRGQLDTWQICSSENQGGRATCFPIGWRGLSSTAVFLRFVVLDQA